MQVSNLRLEIGGFPIHDYRIHEGDLEFRTLSFNGRSYHDNRSTWRNDSQRDCAAFPVAHNCGSVVPGQGHWLAAVEECQHIQQQGYSPLRVLSRRNLRAGVGPQSGYGDPGMFVLDAISAIEFGDGELRIDFAHGEVDKYRIRDGRLQFFSCRSQNLVSSLAGGDFAARSFAHPYRNLAPRQTEAKGGQ